MTYVNHVFQGHILVTPYAKLWTVKKYILIKKKKKGNIFLVLFSHFSLTFLSTKESLEFSKNVYFKTTVSSIRKHCQYSNIFSLKSKLKKWKKHCILFPE